MSQQDFIRIRGARQNNLQGIDLDLPLGKFIVLTGPSGSGKSSLAFDTIYAEGQRRYVETFSPYTRQFMERMDKPQADSIEGIPPAIAIEQANSVKTTRSTVGTITEINDYLKLFMPRVAKASCPECGRAVKPESAQSITTGVVKTLSGQTLLVTFPVQTGEGEHRDTAAFFDFLKSQGYLRVWLNGKIRRTDESAGKLRLPPVVPVIQDRITVEKGNVGRLAEAIETALRFGKDKITLIDEAKGEMYPFSTTWHCAHCDVDIRPPSPGLFSFNNPQGACPSCRGFGRIIGIDYERALPDKSLSIVEGVVKPFQSGQAQDCQRDLSRHARERGIDIYTPFQELSKADQDFIVFGEDAGKSSAEELWESGRWYGVKGFFDWMESKAYKMHIRVLLSRYRSYQPCPSCHGGRYQPDTLNFRLHAKDGRKWTMPELMACPVDPLIEFLQAVSLANKDASAEMLRQQIVSRLSYLSEVGLGYLTLDRPTRTLSGGEIERVNLTTCLGASLVNTLFVMDEPSVGLHPRDTARLIRVMRALKEKGNTLLVVEHEEAVIRAADTLVDIGPGRGKDGGRLMYNGPLQDIEQAPDALTAQYLTGAKSIPLPEKRVKPKRFLELKGIRHNNLKNLTVKFPLGVFCCITGVSGSGKSSLVHDVLYRNLSHEPGDETESQGTIKSVKGAEHVEEIVMVDQSPLAKSPRSTPAVYLGVFDSIREMLGTSEAAIAQGLSPGSFSFNAGKGRCQRCAGLGYEKVEMQFLSDLFLRCPECDGKRYQPHVLAVTLQGKSVHDILEMTVREAMAFFRDKDPRGNILPALQLMIDVGLDYLKLGQPLNVLSGGESQRLKLVSRLAEKTEGKALLIFDEPTTGLHIDDISQLLKVFRRLVEAGDSLLVIEHNLEVIKSADWVIDLGPEAGIDGGKIVAVGPPEEVAECAESHTGRFLKCVLAGESPHTIQEPDRLTTNPLALQGIDAISVRGARQHNLKNISLDIPRDEMVVITGLSGSGKSTLAFDILFAEGQRRFLDSMSPYARQFVQQLEKPEVDSLEGLPPTVAIEQRVTRGGGKSTVATVTEIYHFLRLLFAKLGTQFCPDCHVPVENRTVASMIGEVEKMAQKGKIKIFAPLIKGRKGFHTEVARWAQNHGFEFLLVDGAMQPVAGFQKLERYKEHTIDVLIGEVSAENLKDVSNFLNLAVETGKGEAKVLDYKGKFHTLSTEMNCPSCSRAFEELDPRLFSFNSPYGWCQHCRGFGEVWHVFNGKDFESQLEADLAEERSYESIEEEEARRCPVCQGDRLNDTAQNVFLDGVNICQVVRKSAADAAQTIGQLRFAKDQSIIARDVVPEILQRLTFLGKVGLDYLTLDRAAKTLSGGESQRIRLASQLGSNLRGVLYVLDEPTIGLHPRDNLQLLEALKALKDKGNSLVIVEHDEDTMRQADRIIDLGPGAGFQGGEIVANGRLEEILGVSRSATAQYLKAPTIHPKRGARRSLDDVPTWLELKGAAKHNLKHLDIRIPLHRLSVITGVSGSGKSTLLRSVLVPALKEILSRSGRKKFKDDAWQALLGADQVAALIEMDQSPIGKTSRSTPATYMKVFDLIRELYAQLPASRMRGYTASRFSFNNEGGRCESCQGQGVIKLEMNFLPTSYMPCEDCGGKRYNAPTLEIEYNGKSIGDVMEMTIDEAAGFFSAHPKIRRSLDLLVETGLGYLKLGQPSPTLSGGEAQRIKLVTELARRATPASEATRTSRRPKTTLYILEEPTIGLHAADVDRLIDVLHRLVEEGGTVVVIEHHLDVIAEADYILDIGPEAGEKGGELVGAGTPEKIAEIKTSHTGKFLKTLLAGKS